MKNNIIYILLLAIMGFGFLGCEKEIKTYDGEEGVYFGVQYGTSWNDTTKLPFYPITYISFLTLDGADSIHKVRVIATGRIKDYDRTMRVVVEKDSTTAVEGVNYEKISEEYIIKAGTHIVDIPVKLFLADNVRKESKRLTLKLVPTNDFTLSIPIWNSKTPGLLPENEYPEFDNTRHSLILTNFLVRPKIWSGTPATSDAPVGTQEAGALGQFTEKKFNLICEVMKSKGRDLTYMDFMDSSTMPTALRDVINVVMSEYLIAKYDAKEYVLEEDGRLMWFSKCSGKWNSKIGIPFVSAN